MVVLTRKMLDIVIPNKNEKKFIEVAVRLNYKTIIFLYDKFDEKIREKIEALKGNSKISLNLYSAFLIDEKNMKNISRIKRAYDFVFSYGTRSAFENGKIDLILNLEYFAKRDNLHHRNSGLNQVLCKIAVEKKKVIAFNFNLVLNSENKELIIGRMMQNARFCRKYKLKTMIASFATQPYEMRFWRDLIAFGIVLGMHPREATVAFRGVIFSSIEKFI